MNSRRSPVSIVFALLLLQAGCSLWPLEDRLLSDNDYIRTNALKSVHRMGDPMRDRVIGALLTALRNDDDRITHRASTALVSIGPSAVPALIRAAESNDPFVRTLAVAALGQIGVNWPTVLQALNGALQDPHPLVREEAEHALKSLPS